MSILNWQVAGAPLAIVDVETTGFNPGHDRVVEVSVVHLDQGEPALVLDTLVFPDRSVNLNVHGLTTQQLEDAPRFPEIAASLLDALAGRVVVAHNAAFDLRFLALELSYAGITHFRPPYLCTLELHRTLQAEPPEKCLRRICNGLGIPLVNHHTASADAMAAGKLVQYHRMLMNRRQIRNFGDLREFMQSRCAGSWETLPVPGAPPHWPRDPNFQFQSRADVPIESPLRSVDYSSAVLEALADLELTEVERDYLMDVQQAQGMTPEQIRAAHSAILTWFLSQAAADGWVDSLETERIDKVHGMLAELGWAPGAVREVGEAWGR